MEETLKEFGATLKAILAYQEDFSSAAWETENRLSVIESAAAKKSLTEAHSPEAQGGGRGNDDQARTESLLKRIRNRSGE
mmetsp:Transcript_32789/g.98832  ORF Transcript_32789/g.98832 Transcript_32789/m.98832 type:complete len:80 (+) Transcript_32789:314-553(+)